MLRVHFHENRNTKNSLKALKLQCQLASLPPYLVHQLTWGPFVNTHGGKGHNIPCDLHKEHIKKQFKEIVGSNSTQKASTTAARSVTTLTQTFDQATGIHPKSSAHSRGSDRDDVIKIADVVRQRACQLQWVLRNSPRL